VARQPVVIHNRMADGTMVIKPVNDNAQHIPYQLKHATSNFE